MHVVLGIQKLVKTRTRTQVSSLSHLRQKAWCQGIYSLVCKMYMTSLPCHSYQLCWSTPKKSLTPGPLQEGEYKAHMCNVEVQVLARLEARKGTKKQSFVESLQFPYLSVTISAV